MRMRRESRHADGRRDARRRRRRRHVHEPRQPATHDRRTTATVPSAAGRPACSRCRCPAARCRRPAAAGPARSRLRRPAAVRCRAAACPPGRRHRHPAGVGRSASVGRVALRDAASGAGDVSWLRRRAPGWTLLEPRRATPARRRPTRRQAPRRRRRRGTRPTGGRAGDGESSASRGVTVRRHRLTGARTAPPCRTASASTLTVSVPATHPFNGPFSVTPQVSRYQKHNTSLDFTEEETVSGSCINWAVCKSAPCSRQITTPAPPPLTFLQTGCPSCRPTKALRASLWRKSFSLHPTSFPFHIPSFLRALSVLRNTPYLDITLLIQRCQGGSAVETHFVHFQPERSLSSDEFTL